MDLSEPVKVKSIGVDTITSSHNINDPLLELSVTELNRVFRLVWVVAFHPVDSGIGGFDWEFDWSSA